jgi:hypothetical protein
MPDARFASPLHRAMTALALCAALLGPAPAGAEAAPAPTLQGLRAHQVWLDELPEGIDAAELEVVVLSPDSRCRPPVTKGLFGLTVDPLDPQTGALCRRLEAFVKAPPAPLPLTVRVHTGPLGSRRPAAMLATIEPAPTRRYVALVHWEWAAVERELDWRFEVAVLERASGRWLWHGARAHWVWPQPEWRERTELRALQALLRHELPRDLLNPGWWRDALPLPGARWVPVAEQEAYRPEPGRAGLAIVNGYASATPTQDVRYLKLRPAGTPEVDDTEVLRQGDWSQWGTVRRAQATPLLAPSTQALLDLPAGDYLASFGQASQPLRLESGPLTVMRIGRALGNATTGSVEAEAWWRERVAGGRLRHAFLAEPPSRGNPPVRPYFEDRGP